MTIADEARDNALHCEMVKYAYRQTRDGVVVSFVVHPNDIPAELSTSHIGARFMVALVQIGDDEQPVRKEAMPHSATVRLDNAKPQPDVPRSAGAKHMDWRDVQPAAQAGIRCGEPTFWAFLREARNVQVNDKGDAEVAVREICCVHSRVELGTDHRKRVIWHLLDAEYLAWKLVSA